MSVIRGRCFYQLIQSFHVDYMNHCKSMAMVLLFKRESVRICVTEESKIEFDNHFMITGIDGAILQITLRY